MSSSRGYNFLEDNETSRGRSPSRSPARSPRAKQEMMKSYDHETGGLGWIGCIVLWFIVLAVLFWIILYSFAPGIVMRCGTQEVDNGKVLLCAVIAALIIVVIFWIIKMICMHSKKY